jgi:predicted MFS family arabinose efflux permease
MRDMDPVGQLLAVVTLFGTVFVLIEGPSLGWTHQGPLGVAVVAVVALVAFLRYEGRRVDPFIDLRFFRSVPFASATVIAVCAFAGWAAFLFMMSLYLQGERGYSAMQTGLIYLPIALGALVFSPLSGRLVGRYGSRPSLLAAGVLITGAAAMLMLLTPNTPIWALLLIFAAYGIGFAMVNAPVTNAAVSGMPRDRAGAASAVTSTSRQVGVSIGVALCGSVAGSALTSVHVGFTDAARPLWLINVGLGLVISVLAVTSTSSRARRSAERLAPLIDDRELRVAHVA